MTRKFLFLLTLGMSFLFVACGGASEPAEEVAVEDVELDTLTARAELSPTEGNEVAGEVTFEEVEGGVKVSAEITGLTPGLHGFHIHETGDCSAPDATSAGGHFNPEDEPHGAPDSGSHHVGDLGNLEANEEGVATYEATYSFLSLSPGDDHNIFGRAVIVHSGEDDFATQPTGAAGSRVACGVIE